MQNINKQIVEGIACDAKVGAVIVTKNEVIYYIDGLDFWDSKYLNKKVRVSGEIKEIEKVELSDSLKYSQNPPNRKIIFNANYELIKK